MHLIQRRWVASTVDINLYLIFICVLLWGKGAVFLLFVSQSSFPFPTTRCSDHLYCAMLWPVFYYLMQYCSTDSTPLNAIVTNLSPWCYTMIYMAILKISLWVKDAFHLSLPHISGKFSGLFIYFSKENLKFVFGLSHTHYLVHSFEKYLSISNSLKL